MSPIEGEGMNVNEGNVSDVAESIADALRESRDFARAAYAYDFDEQRRNIPSDASGLEIDRWKDPYLLEYLGLEPLPGDPTIEDMERMLDDDFLLEPAEIELAVNEVIADTERLNESGRAVIAARVDAEWRHSGRASTRAIFNHPRLLNYLGLGGQAKGES